MDKKREGKSVISLDACTDYGDHLIFVKSSRLEISWKGSNTKLLA